ncbi:hypothetical protein [Thiohalophilus sp.]|uniref:hypothetical protein n=1 Tax=Thiohalophilus sp. TaxID=3028392 RepID=UPI002ACE14D9|nr:hypothetical protein [Thiohalophilus sp.]MDZ7661065.1 hypothetical protein [Thiohalophilus sp.]
MTMALPGPTAGAAELSEEQREAVAERLGITPEELEALQRGEFSGEKLFELQRRMGEGLSESLQDPNVRRRLQENMPGDSEQKVFDAYDRNPAVLDPCLVGRWRLDNGTASTDNIAFSGLFELEINPSGRSRAHYRDFTEEIMTRSVFNGEKTGCVRGQSPRSVLIEWEPGTIEEKREHVVTGVMVEEEADGGPRMPAGYEIYRCADNAIVFGGTRFEGAGKAPCEDLVSRARERFHIPPPGESGHDVLDGWWLHEARRGNPRAQRAGLMRGRQVLARQLAEYLEAHPDARRHIEDTMEMFERELGIEAGDGEGERFGADLNTDELPIDTALVLAKGARESGVADLLSTSDRVIVSSGREVHPEGESGLDYLFNHRDDFPPSAQDDIRPVPREELTERGRARASPPAPARLPLKYLLAAFIVETRRAEQGFVQKLREEMDGRSTAELRRALNNMSDGARRAWSQLHFGLPGAVRNVLREIAASTPGDEPPDLDRLLTDPTFRSPDFSTAVVRFGIRRSLVTAAEAWLIENYRSDCRLQGGCALRAE